MNSFLQVFDPANIGAFFTQFQADMQRPAFWLAVGKIIWINILLSGDNALVIAMKIDPVPNPANRAPFNEQAVHLVCQLDDTKLPSS